MLTKSDNLYKDKMYYMRIIISISCATTVEFIIEWDWNIMYTIEFQQTTNPDL